jgi:threonine dehydratase
VRPGIAVIGAEPELADDACRSLETGRRQPPREPLTVADGLRTALGEIPFAVLRQRVERILLAGEAEILDAMRLLWERAKIVVEPSGAVPLAAVLGRRGGLEGKRVGLILSGGNVDFPPPARP